MAKERILRVQKATVKVIYQKDTDYISLTDMTVSFKEGSGLIGKWITNKNTLEYLGVWEKINNPHFNYPEFGVMVRKQEQTDSLCLLASGLPEHLLSECS
ncbi:KilA-N domain-containing protein [Niabella ginsengisoli]|uniref:KilA-N domain-containing protein n=1 Tax=Niabella ginsengisoli TaxID=522298 RepID=UPI0021D3FC58|nr:KilA-N domain-containing protein [Niabella ginsengisoli]